MYKNKRSNKHIESGLIEAPSLSQVYYYGVDGFVLTETCKVNKIKGVKIGSVSCTECQYNKGYSDEESWIICEKRHEL